MTAPDVHLRLLPHVGLVHEGRHLERSLPPRSVSEPIWHSCDHPGYSLHHSDSPGGDRPRHFYRLLPVPELGDVKVRNLARLSLAAGDPGQWRSGSGQHRFQPSRGSWANLGRLVDGLPMTLLPTMLIASHLFGGTCTPC